MTKTRVILSFLLFSFFTSILPVRAEKIDFNLYLNAAFINIQAGSSCLYDESVTYEGHRAIKTAMTMNTNSKADKIVSIRDTIESYNSTKGESLFYRKMVHEGSKQFLETAEFSREKHKYMVHMTKLNRTTNQIESQASEWKESRIFDILSMLAYTRTIDTSTAEPGLTHTLFMVNGDMVLQQCIVYTGNEIIKADDGKEYDCMIVSVRDYKEGKERETIKAYVTHDKQHKPIRLDMNIGMGMTLKALLKQYNN